MTRPGAAIAIDRLLRFTLALLAGWHAAVFLLVILWRLGYPYDLEWMEGGMLLHAQRIGAGQPLYGPPSLEFVPFLYTPLYPALVALLAKVIGLGYLAGRLISIGCFLGALALGYRAARHAGSTPLIAASAMVAVCAAFPFVGGWYDLCRNDELFLLLGAAGFAVLLRWPTARGALAAAALLAASYFAKQTGSALVVAGLLLLLVLNARAAWAYAVTAAIALAVPILALQHATGGWFWRWCAQAHAAHPFYAHRALVYTPWTLFRQAPSIWGALLGVLVLLGRRRLLSRMGLAWLLVAAAGIGIACIGFGTQWAFTNAFIPAVFFPLAALGVLAAAPTLPRWLVPGALALQLALALYDPRPFLPRRSDREAGQRLIARIAAVQGDVLVPFHPFYAVLAGKRPFLHRMGVLDAPSAGFGRPSGLDEAIAEARFALVIQDYKVRWEEWPGLERRYQTIARLKIGYDAARTFSGADTAPYHVLVPRDARASTLPHDGESLGRQERSLRTD